MKTLALLLLAAAPAFAGDFCTSELYTYRDQPVVGYSLSCANDALGLSVYHSVRNDLRHLFAPGGECSAANYANVILRSREAAPFELYQNNSQPSSGARNLRVYRDAKELKPGEFDLNLTWIQGGDEFRLGYDPKTGATPSHPFRMDHEPAISDQYVLAATDLPFTFKTDKTVNGKAVSYAGVPVDCVLQITVGSWADR